MSAPPNHSNRSIESISNNGVTVVSVSFIAHPQTLNHLLNHIWLKDKICLSTPKQHGVCCFGLGAKPILFLYYLVCCTVSRQPVTSLASEFVQDSPFLFGDNNMTTAFICGHLINQLLPSDPVQNYMSDFCCQFNSRSISFPQVTNDISDDMDIW